MNDFRGVYPALITPMTSDDRLHEEAVRRVVQFNIDAGVHGFWVAGGSGESVLLDDEENRRLAEITADQAAGRARIIMHVGAPTTRRAAAMAEHAARAGCDAICCIPPFFYGHSDDAIVEHYRVVAGAAALPFFVYNLPKATGVEVTPELLGRLQDEVPQLTGLKHSAANFSNVREFTRMGAACFIGSATLMLPALSMGAAGCIDGWPGMVPQVWVELWNAFQAGDMAGALEAQDRGIEIVKTRRFGQMHSVIKAVLSDQLGIDCGAARPPGEPLTDSQHDALRAALRELGVAGVAAQLG